MILSDALFRSATICKFLNSGQSIFEHQLNDLTYNNPKPSLRYRGMPIKTDDLT